MELGCNIESILLSRENEGAVLQKLSSYTNEFRFGIANSIDTEITKIREMKSKIDQNTELISDLSDQLREWESKLENIHLEEKVIKKKISNCMELEAKVMKDIEEQKARKESIALEMVDIEEELNRKKQAKLKEWNSIKLATKIYKEKLNFHIDFKPMEDHDRVIVTFFYNRNPNRDNYYVILSNYDNTIWKVNQIKPALKDEYLKKMRLDFEKDYNYHEIIAFLYQIRWTFLKYYSA